MADARCSRTTPSEARGDCTRQKQYSCEPCFFLGPCKGKAYRSTPPCRVAPRVAYMAPQINVPLRTVHAVCMHFAHLPEYPLDSEALARAVQSKLPEAEILRGFGRSASGVTRCSWVRVGDKDYDVERLARLRRWQVAGALKCEEQPYPEERELLTEPSLAESAADHLASLKSWTLPSCPACCGMHRRHTLDDGCVTPWKTQLLETRTSDNCVRLGCLVGYGQGHNSQECYKQLAKLAELRAAAFSPPREVGLPPRDASESGAVAA